MKSQQPVNTRSMAIQIGGSNVPRHDLAQRLLHGVKHLPSLSEMAASEDADVWGVDGWTGEEFRSILVEAMFEGMSCRQALDMLSLSYGRMPSYRVVQTWRKKFKQFGLEYQAALESRGEQAADAATEIALGMDPDSAPADKEKVKHLQWLASKLSKATYGEHKTVDVNQKPSGDLTTEQLDSRIAAVMARLGMAPVPTVGCVKVVEAEVIEAEEAPLPVEEEDPTD